MQNGKIGFLLIGIVAGVTITLLATFFYWVSYERQIRLQAMTVGIADRTHSMVPLLINLEEQDIENLRMSVRNQLLAGLVIADANLELLDEQGRETVLPVLESIAAKRDRMKIGKYATPPQPDTERILARYDN